VSPAKPDSPSGVLLLDKPEGFSSTQALSRAKRFLACRKAGHTGTLDPFATGLLPLVFGEATKFSRFLIDAAKSYQATLRLGVESTTGDTEGELTAQRPVAADAATVDRVLATFLGASEQVPPMHSAVRIGGKRLYEFAREGLEVERAARAIEILALERVALEGEILTISVTCSKGTYVRTLAADIGRALGCGAYLTALRRTGMNGLDVSQAVGLQELEREGVLAARARLLPVDRLVAELPRLDAPAQPAWRFSQGQGVACEAAQEGEEWAVYGPAGVFLGVATAPRQGWLAPLRLMSPGGAAADAPAGPQDA
jgi:tRNA pseudouridine55 synthase